MFPSRTGMDERALCNNKDKKMEAIKIIRYLSPVGEMMIVYMAAIFAFATG